MTSIPELNVCKLVLLIYTAAFYTELIKPLRVSEMQFWYFMDCTASSTAWQMKTQHLKSHTILGNSMHYLDTVITVVVIFFLYIEVKVFKGTQLSS